MVITYRNPARGQLNRKTYFSLSPFAPDRLGSPVTRQLAHLHTQADSGFYVRVSSRFPRRPLFIHLNRRTPSGQSRVYRVTHLRTDAVDCGESARPGPVNIKVVPNGCCLGRSPWTNCYALLFPTPTIGMKWAFRKYRLEYFVQYKYKHNHKHKAVAIGR